VSPSFAFRDSWEVAAPVAAVHDMLVDLERYPDWWPQVRAVAKISDDTARVLCRSALPYTLDLVLDAVSREAPVLEVAVSGDLDGWVRWTLSPEGSGTRTDFTQEVAVAGALAWASYVVRPLMRGCEDGLRARLEGDRE
jgi:carbon monoxide dehydrogenase subunit G